MPVIELRGLRKAFGPVVANADINLSVRRGSIHAVIGENGAGKSTAMKMLYGIYSPDEGEILVNGVARRWKSPRDAIAAGIGMVHQHFMLAGPYTALENVLAGAEPSRFGFLPRFMRPVDFSGGRRKLQALSSKYGLEVNFDAPVESLAVGVQQRLEILKLLYRDAQILILDEPTAVLTPQETLELFENLKGLVREGKTIIIITHKLKEVMHLADRVTVFRAGRVVGEREKAATNIEDLASLMVGRKVNLTVEAPKASNPGTPVLELDGLRLEPVAGSGETRLRLKDVTFNVCAGEVVGIAGVEGNGQSELLQSILHPRDQGSRLSGRISCLGREVTRAHSREIKDLGVGVIPEDRHREGLLLERSVAENFLLGLQRLPGFKKSGFVDSGSLQRRATQAMDTYDVRPRSLDHIAGRMSGGNQQKLIIAREFERKPKFLIAAQPTRGVDVGAIEFIHKRILDAARTEGMGVLLVSSELDEVLALSDRILVMYGGRIVGEFARGSATEQQLGLLMGGGSA